MHMDIHHDKLLILDFGSQYTQLIARRIREIGVYCEIYAFDADAQAIIDFQPKGVILSGGPESVYEAEDYRIPQCVFDLGVPLLGICYGMQSMAIQCGGTVEGSDHCEFGYAEVKRMQDAPLLNGLDQQLKVWMSHGDKVTQLPEGFALLGGSDSAPIAIMGNKAKQYYGVQFHPEVTHTECGLQLLQNFALDICYCGANWTASNIIDDAITTVREQVGDQHVILGLSGGVDSSVVAALLHKAISTQLTCVFVDTGLLRLHEGDQVMETFAEHMGVKVIRVNAEDRYMRELAGVADPEQKRKIIGRLFVEIFQEEANKLDGVQWLAQGTIYPDVIESAGSKTGKAHVIKSHHNVGGLPEKMHLKLLEPLRELFKDEVRKVGVALGLPEPMVYRHPFPGPGLGVRILSEVSYAAAETLRQADAIFIAELRAAGWYEQTSQAFAVFLPVCSVGVTGDQRKYAPVIALRAVQTIDFMTARWAHLPYELLDKVSHRIVNEVPNVSRVVYDVSGKPPATIEWE